jgi:ribosomal-protein-alanine N-acetyltransferase
MVEEVSGENLKIDANSILTLLNQELPKDNFLDFRGNLINFDVFFERLSLRGLEEMHNYSKNNKLYDFFEFDRFKSLDETESYIKKLISRMKPTSSGKLAQYWFIRKKDNNALIGTACLVSIDVNRKSAELGFAIDPDEWGRGYINQVLEILKYYFFEIMRFNRLHGVTMINNTRTINSILCSGGVQEGLLRDFYFKHEKFIDGWAYSIIKSDYLSKKNKLENKSQLKIDDIIKVVAEVLNDPSVDENCSTANNPNWDSLNHINIFSAFKKKFSIDFSPLQISQAISIKSIYEIYNSQIYVK